VRNHPAKDVRQVETGVVTLLESKALEEQHAEVVDVLAAKLCAALWSVELRIGDALANAVTAQLNGFADGQDVRRLNVLVDQAARVKG
jgi:hypothetical protein